MTDEMIRNTYVDDVGRWLNVATKRLGDEGTERVEKEILSHYHDALEDGVKKGKTQNEAHVAAMDSLGNARKAGKGFRRVYLTRLEERQLEVLESSVWDRLKSGKKFEILSISCVALGMPYLMMMSFMYNPGPNGSYMRAFITAMILVSLIIYGLNRYLVRIGALDRLILWAAATMLGLIPLLPILFWGGEKSIRDSGWLLVIVLFFTTILLRNAYLLWTLYKKVRVVGEEDTNGE